MNNLALLAAFHTILVFRSGLSFIFSFCCLLTIITALDEWLVLQLLMRQSDASCRTVYLVS